MKLTRRALIRALGTTGLALPFLHPREGRGDTFAPSRKLVILCSPNGSTMEHFFPNGVSSLAGWSPAASAVLKPLEPYKDRMCILRGINNEAASSSAGSMFPNHDPDNTTILTAAKPVRTNGPAPGGISIDQYIAAELGVGVRTLGVNSGGVVSATGSGAGVTPTSDPQATYVSLFSSYNVPNDEGSKRARHGIVDLGLAETDALRCELGGADRDKLDQHLGALHKIELKLDDVLSCTVPAEPGAPVSYVHRVEMEMDLMVEALACEIADVITMQWDGFASDRKFPELPGNFANIGHHTGAHDGAPFGGNGAQQREYLRMVDQWYAARIAYFVGKLSGRQLTDGTSLLDHTAVLWCHEQAEGGNHARCDMPYLLVGSCGGRLRTGIARDFGGRHGPDGDGVGAVRGPEYASNKLFIAIANAMGVATDSFGDMSLSTTGPFEELLV